MLDGRRHGHSYYMELLRFGELLLPRFQAILLARSKMFSAFY